jgi:death-on-curing protein
MSAADVLEIHSLVINETGGSHGVRDRGVLLSLEDAPRQSVFGEELYPTLFLKAALYARNIIRHHPFIDGNKRTGIAVAAEFLEDNGYIFYAERGEIEYFALAIFEKRLELDAIGTWLKSHARKRPKQTKT